jgi:hypothetical protein
MNKNKKHLVLTLLKDRLLEHPESNHHSPTIELKALVLKFRLPLPYNNSNNNNNNNDNSNNKYDFF